MILILSAVSLAARVRQTRCPKTRVRLVDVRERRVRVPLISRVSSTSVSTATTNHQPGRQGQGLPCSVCAVCGGDGDDDRR